MEVLLSKEHYCFQIHIIYILMKSSVYLPSIIDNPLIFTRQSWPCLLLWVQVPINRGLRTIIIIFTEVFLEFFAQTLRLFSKKQFGYSLGKSQFNSYWILFAVKFSWLISVNLGLTLITSASHKFSWLISVNPGLILIYSCLS